MFVGIFTPVSVYKVMYSESVDSNPNCFQYDHDHFRLILVMLFTGGLIYAKFKKIKNPKTLMELIEFC